MVSGKQFHENFAQRPDIASEIEGAVVDNVWMTSQKSLQHGPGLIHLGIKEAGEFVIYFNFKLFPLTFENNDVVQNKMRDKVTDLVEALEDRGYPVKKAKSHTIVLEASGR
jgi:hypothetical protein